MKSNKFIFPSTTLMFFGAIPIIGIPVGLWHIAYGSIKMKEDKRYRTYRFLGEVECIPFVNTISFFTGFYAFFFDSVFDD